VTAIDRVHCPKNQSRTSAKANKRENVFYYFHVEFSLGLSLQLNRKELSLRHLFSFARSKE